MPVVVGPNRREFLRTLAISAGAAWVGGCARLSARVGKPGKAVRWAFLSDTHVTLDETEKYRNALIDANFRKAASQVIEAAPEGVVITGDVARLQGKPGDYEMLVRLSQPLAARMPVAFVLGNHDHRDNFLKAFPKRSGMAAPVAKKHVAIFETGDLRFLMLDSLFLVNEGAGLLGKAQRQWLAEYLDRADRRPTFLFLHHQLEDSDGALLDADRLLKIVQPRRQVKAIFYGHTHVYQYEKIDGLHLINLPAVGYNFTDRQPLGWLDARMTARGGEFTLRAFAVNVSDNGKTTSLAWR